MANDGKERRAISSRIDALNTRLDDIYKSTYSSDTTTRDIFDNISDDIYNSVAKILSSNSDIQTLPDIAQLYTRIEKKQGGPRLNKEVMDNLVDLFNDNTLMNTMMANPEINRYIKSKDLQVDMILKYMPKLKTALEIKKDNVLAAEDFSKSFLHVVNPSASENDEDKDVFVMRAKQMIKKYDIEEKFESAYDDASKYGEQFIYLVPYKKAFEALHRQREKDLSGISTVDSISTPLTESVILEGGKIADIDDRNFVSKTADKDKLSEEYSLNQALKDLNTTVKVQYNDTNIIESAIREAEAAKKTHEYSNGKSIHENFLNEANANKSHKTNEKMSDSGKPISSDRISPRAAKYKLDKVAPDELEYDKLYDKANDGLVVQGTSKENDVELNDIPGFVYKKLNREDVIPIYIEGICMGYYYLEFSYMQNEDIDRSRMLLNDTFETITNHQMKQENDVIIKYIASKISSEIDNHFINANQDLKQEIYAILKYDHRFNSNYDSNIINVTFIPPSDIYHFYFTLDDILHRGVSDLEDAILPALFWVLLMLSTTIGNATRSQDHRVWWVKQNIETNIAKTMMNVINQLKKGNMGIRQMQSMNNILGIIGRYNDYIIPVGPSGEAAVTFDTIQGQDIKTPEELINRFEENAINSTDVPIEMVNTVYQVDYATRFTMANSRFLRKILKRQDICQTKYSQMFMRMYNYEYMEDEVNLEIKLPEPVFLKTVNGLAMLNNTRDYVEAVTNLVYPDGVEVDDAEKAKFRKEYSETLLATYIDVKLIHRIQDKISIDKFGDKFKNTEGGSEGEEELEGEEGTEI